MTRAHPPAPSYPTAPRTHNNNEKQNEIKISTRFRCHTHAHTRVRRTPDSRFSASHHSTPLHITSLLSLTAKRNLVRRHITQLHIYDWCALCARALPTAAGIQLRISKFYYIDWHITNHKNLLFTSHAHTHTRSQFALSLAHIHFHFFRFAMTSRHGTHSARLQ